MGKPAAEHRRCKHRAVRSQSSAHCFVSGPSQSPRRRRPLLKMQCRIFDFLDALGISAVQYPGVEGDDIIASIALAAAEEPGVEARARCGPDRHRSPLR